MDADPPGIERDARFEQLSAELEELRRRVSELTDRSHAQNTTILELHTEAALTRAKVANLEAALQTSRSIGEAMGIVMAEHQVPEDEAFAILRKASMDTNRKLRELATEVVETGELPES